MCKSFPVIKSPAAGLPIATSLCRLGFPFREVKVTYDEAADQFGIPQGGLAYFPIEGIYTRSFDSGIPAGTKYHIAWIETSSPGLRGQSGGPIYDTKGRVWGIQSRTQHLDLGFEAQVKVGGRRPSSTRSSTLASASIRRLWLMSSPISASSSLCLPIKAAPRAFPR